jgi:hypothetical protein
VPPQSILDIMSIFRHDLKDLRADYRNRTLCSTVGQEFRTGRPKVVTQQTAAKAAEAAEAAEATAFTKFFIASKIESSRSLVFVSALGL